MSHTYASRSQAILRMPVDRVEAVMILHDGERSDVLVFVPPSEEISQRLTHGHQFLPVMQGAQMRLVARSSIACFGVSAGRAPRLEDVPTVQQAVQVKLRSGLVLDGKMRWIAQPDYQRTVDHLNNEGPYLVLHCAEAVYVVVKAHVATVTEV